MFRTPSPAEDDARRCLASLGGLDERPPTAESTLVSGVFEVSAAMMNCSLLVRRVKQRGGPKSHDWNRQTKSKDVGYH